MKTIVVKTQADLDALPDSFSEHTVIEIRSDASTWIKVTKSYGSSRVVAYDLSRVVARGSSRVVAYGSSRVVAYDLSRVVAYDLSRVEAYSSSRVVAYDSSSVVVRGSSRVVAYDSSSVVAYDSSSIVAYGSSSVVAYGSSRVVAMDFTTIAVFSASVIIHKLLDYSVASLRNVKVKIEKKSKTATVIKTPGYIQRPFAEWLKLGYVHADGITKKLLSRKKIGNTEVFEVEEFLTNKSSYVVKRGNTFSHGETVEKAIEGLRYKLSDRDTSQYKRWKLDDKKPIEDVISAYRAITGACEFGTRQFCESKKLKKTYSVKEVIALTKGAYGNEEFAKFWGVK